MRKNKRTESFCHSILQLGVGKSKALANLVMSLCSQPTAGSVTALSLSPCYHYQYSSIADAINALFESKKYPEAEWQKARLELEQKLLLLKRDYLAKPFEKFYLLNTDSSSLIRPHSPTLAGRSHVYVANNRVKGNRPVDIGYSISVVGLSARRPLYSLCEPAWNLPLSIRRLEVGSQGHEFAARQVNDLLGNQDLPFGQALTLNVLDRYYGSPEYIAPTYEQPNLVNIIRLKNNRVIWKALDDGQREQRRAGNADQRGANAVYGQKYKLKHIEQWDMAPDEETTFGVALSNGRRVLVQVQAWDRMMIRTKRGVNMKDKPFKLISVRLLDGQTNEPIFKRRMWLGVWGQRAEELSLEEFYWAYCQRFDVEHFLRFGKQNLLMDSFQTPDVEHLEIGWRSLVWLIGYFG